MKKKLYNILIDDCIAILVRDDWDSDINQLRVIMNYLLIHFFVKPVRFDFMCVLDAIAAIEAITPASQRD